VSGDDPKAVWDCRVAEGRRKALAAVERYQARHGAPPYRARRRQPFWSRFLFWLRDLW
jgi:hypothetical protein